MSPSELTTDALVLVVDDDEICRELCVHRIESWGYRTAAAATGAEAMSLFESGGADVVLLDVLLPDMDGLEVAANIKRLTRGTHVPILLCTSLDDSDTLRTGLDKGADDFLGKPINTGVLRARLQAALRTRVHFQQMERQNAQLREMTDIDNAEQELTERILKGVVVQDCLAEPWINYLSWPKVIFNGDLVMAARTPSGRTWVMIGDSTGHGLAAAVAAVPMAEMFRTSVNEDRSLWSFLVSANEKLAGYLPVEMFLVVSVVELDPAAGRALVWNGGGPGVVVIGDDGVVRKRVDSTNLPLGVLRSMDHGALPIEVPMEAGDRMFLCSDGLTEAIDVNGVELGMERVVDLCSARASGSTEWRDLRGELDQHVRGAKRLDDMTLIEIDWDRVGEHSSRTSQHEERLRVAVDLSFAMLGRDRCFEPVRTLIAALPASPQQRREILRVTVELFTNAVDHGLLGLGSVEDRGARREEAMARLREGTVRVELALNVGDTAWELVIQVADTGPGFRPPKASPANSDEPVKGIAMIRSMCDRLEYRGRGNIARATYSWPKVERPALEIRKAG